MVDLVDKQYVHNLTLKCFEAILKGDRASFRKYNAKIHEISYVLKCKRDLEFVSDVSYTMYQLGEALHD